MAHTLSSKKRARQNEKRRVRNRARKSQVKSAVRRFTDAVAGKDASTAEGALVAAVKKIDQVAAKGTLHKNTASRKKSRLQKRLNVATSSG